VKLLLNSQWLRQPAFSCCWLLQSHCVRQLVALRLQPKLCYKSLLEVSGVARDKVHVQPTAAAAGVAYPITAAVECALAADCALQPPTDNASVMHNSGGD
jgi:hypothetical protein